MKLVRLINRSRHHETGNFPLTITSPPACSCSLVVSVVAFRVPCSCTVNYTLRWVHFLLPPELSATIAKQQVVDIARISPTRLKHRTRLQLTCTVCMVWGNDYWWPLWRFRVASCTHFVLTEWKISESGGMRHTRRQKCPTGSWTLCMSRNPQAASVRISRVIWRSHGGDYSGTRRRAVW